MNIKKHLGIWVPFLLACAIVGGIYAIYHHDHSKQVKIKQTQEEIALLQKIKEAVTAKYLPVYSDRRMMLVDSIYAADGNSYEEALQKANKQALQTPDELYKSVEKCEPCMYIQSLLLKKTMELNELQEKGLLGAVFAPFFCLLTFFME